MTEAQVQKFLARKGELTTEEKRQRFAKSMGDEIIAGVWVSDLQTVKAVRGRIDTKMDAVVSVCQDACDFSDAESFHIPIAETSNQEESMGGEMSFAQFAEAADTVGQLLDEGKEVLVHCHAGVNRSVGSLAAALAVRRDLSVSEAIQLIADERPRANPLQKTRAWMEAYIAGLHATEDQADAVDAIIHKATSTRRTGGYSGSPNGSYAGRDGTYSVASTDTSSTHPDPDLTEVEGWGDIEELTEEENESNARSATQSDAEGTEEESDESGGRSFGQIVAEYLRL